MNFDILLAAYIITSVVIITVIVFLIANIVLNNKKINKKIDKINDAIGMDNITNYLSLYGYLDDVLNKINMNIGKPSDDKTLALQNKDLRDLIIKDADTEKQRFMELETRLRNIAIELHNINEHRDIPK